MRITFANSCRNMSYNYYLKEKRPMCEIKLNQILHRNPSLAYSLDTDLGHPMINHFITVADEIIDDDEKEFD